MAVGGILLAIAIPGYAFLVNTSKLAAVTNELVSPRVRIVVASI
jgi:type IV fimbrial biogenesis protein FimT